MPFEIIIFSFFYLNKGGIAFLGCKVTKINDARQIFFVFKNKMDIYLQFYYYFLQFFC